MVKKNNYLNNSRFEEVIKNYLQTPNEYERELVELLDVLITNILMSFKTLKNFNPGNGSAFNYFTTVIVNNLKLLYTKNKKYHKKLQDYKESIVGPNTNAPREFEDPYASSSYASSSV